MLKPWREIIVPHKDVAGGKYQQAEFAANLAQVVSGNAEPEYQDAVHFFDRTYLTQGMKILLTTALKIDDERKTSDGSNQVVSKQVNFIYLTKTGKIIHAGYAPYLDCRPSQLGEFDKTILNEDWIKNSPEKTIIDYALTEITPEEFKKVELRRQEYIQKTMKAVMERLTKEIFYWDNRANELKEKELVGKERVGLNSGKAREKADELQARLSSRIDDLKKQQKLISKQPFVIGGALVLPASMVSKDIPDYAVNEANRTKTELIAMEEIMKTERMLGREPKDVHEHNYGWDIESIDPKTKDIFFIEVKGRVKGADIITVSSNEIKTGKNVTQDNPSRYILAVVEVEDDKPLPARYVRSPFEKIEIDFSTTSMNFDIKKLLSKSEEPR